LFNLRQYGVCTQSSLNIGIMMEEFYFWDSKGVKTNMLPGFA